MEVKFEGVTTNLRKPSFKSDCVNEELIDGEVKVKVMSSPVNPSDFYMTIGMYGVKELYRSQEEMGVGLEGAGEVVEVGPGADPSLLG
jgi:NADPH:quinone reductase-like Zn-dependent oxidoreductase